MLRRIIMVLAAGALMVPLAACDFTARVDCHDKPNGNVVCEGDGTYVPAPPGTTTPAPTTTTRPVPTTEPPAPTTAPPAPTASAPPVLTTPPTTTQPVPAAQTAAQRFGWGQPRWADEFEYTGAPDSSKWSTPLNWGPGGCGPGHAGQGRRCHKNSTVADGALTQVGAPGGDTGWIGSEPSWYRGRLETRMRVVDTPGRDNEYHPVLLMWPTAEDFPVGGEIDYAEMTSRSDSVDFFLHYGANNNQTHSEKKVNILDWNNYAVEWTPDCITGFINGTQFFQDCNKSHLPPRQMFATIQLDYFPDSSPGPGETKMQVDWVRSYSL